MSNRRPDHRRRDQGYVLVMVLLFVALVGLLTVALLQQTSTSLGAVGVAGENEARISAVNAAVDVVIRDIESDTDGSCSGTMLELNTVWVEASCSELSGPPAPTPTVVVQLGDDGSQTTVETSYAVYYWAILSAPTPGPGKTITAEASVEYLVTTTTTTVLPPPEPSPAPPPTPIPGDPVPVGNLQILSWAISNP